MQSLSSSLFYVCKRFSEGCVRGVVGVDSTPVATVRTEQACLFLSLLCTLLCAREGGQDAQRLNVSFTNGHFLVPEKISDYPYKCGCTLNWKDYAA